MYNSLKEGVNIGVETFKRTRFINKERYTDSEISDMKFLHAAYKTAQLDECYKDIGNTTLAMNFAVKKSEYKSPPVVRKQTASLFFSQVEGAFALMKQYDVDREERLIKGYPCDPKELLLDLIRNILNEVESTAHADSVLLQRSIKTIHALEKFLQIITTSQQLFGDEPNSDTGIMSLLIKVKDHCSGIAEIASREDARICAKDILQSMYNIGKQVVEYSVVFLYYVANNQENLPQSFTLSNAMMGFNKRLTKTAALEALNVLINSPEMKLLMHESFNTPSLTFKGYDKKSSEPSAEELVILDDNPTYKTLGLGAGVSSYQAVYLEHMQKKKLPNGIVDSLSNDKNFMLSWYQAHVVVQDFSAALVLVERATEFAKAGGDIAIYILGYKHTQKMLNDLICIKSHLLESLEHVKNIVLKERSDYQKEHERLPKWYKNFGKAESAFADAFDKAQLIERNAQLVLAKIISINISDEKEKWRKQIAILDSMSIDMSKRLEALTSGNATANEPKIPQLEAPKAKIKFSTDTKSYFKTDAADKSKDKKEATTTSSRTTTSSVKFPQSVHVEELEEDDVANDNKSKKAKKGKSGSKEKEKKREKRKSTSSPFKRFSRTKSVVNLSANTLPAVNKVSFSSNDPSISNMAAQLAAMKNDMDRLKQGQIETQALLIRQVSGARKVALASGFTGLLATVAVVGIIEGVSAVSLGTAIGQITLASSVIGQVIIPVPGVGILVGLCIGLLVGATFGAIGYISYKNKGKIQQAFTALSNKITGLFTGKIKEIGLEGIMKIEGLSELMNAVKEQGVDLPWLPHVMSYMTYDVNFYIQQIVNRKKQDGLDDLRSTIFHELIGLRDKIMGIEAGHLTTFVNEAGRKNQVAKFLAKCNAVIVPATLEGIEKSQLCIENATLLFNHVSIIYLNARLPLPSEVLLHTPEKTVDDANRLLDSENPDLDQKSSAYQKNWLTLSNLAHSALGFASTVINKEGSKIAIDNSSIFQGLNFGNDKQFSF